MLKNYFKIAWRNLVKNKVSSFINVGGLAAGMAVAMIIGLWVYDELSFNKNHQNYERIAKVMQNQTFDGEIRTGGNQAMQLGPELRNSYGRHFKYIIMSSGTNGHTLSFGEKRFTLKGNYMEPEAPDMLTLKMLKGTRAGLKDPSSILLSESVARGFFGDDEPIDKIIKIDNKLPVKVTGVYEDLPSNSSFADLTFIAPWELKIKSEELEQRVHWGNSWFETFVQIADHETMSRVSKKIIYAKRNKAGEDDGLRFNPEMFLNPMSQWHLYSEFKNGVSVGGRITSVWMFGIIGAFVLLLACINFMNLSTARSEKRAKEVGIRKAVGSVRSQLIGQFFSESLLVVTFSFVVSLLLVQLMMPFFNDLADKNLVILWSNPLFWLVEFCFCLITGLIAGSYPAFYLSSFQPVKVLKGTFRIGRFASIPRKALVIVQFSISITLIICTIIIFRQIQFAKKRSIGYNRDNLIAIPIKTEEIKKHYQALRNDLIKTGAVVELAQSSSPVTNAYTTNSGWSWKGKDPNKQDEFITVALTHEFGKTVGWNIKEGRDFSSAYVSDSSGFILNEVAVKYMNLKNPIGESVDAFGQTYHIIGVVKDMMMQSPYQSVRPMVFYIDTYDRVKLINIKMNSNMDASESLSKIKTVFKKYDPANAFEYKFADQEYDLKFKAEERIGKLASFFSMLAIFISCLGLFGMASFIAEQRTKEIGVRKVLGASVFQLWRLLSKEFVMLVLISCLISIPVAHYFMSEWLQNYQYRSEISLWIFGAAAMGALVITLLTVSFQAIKAALMNPVNSLRTE